MVSIEHIIATTIILGISLLLPVIACLVVKRRTKASLVNLLVGALVFIICFVIATATSVLGSMLIASPVILTLVLSLRAGLVEESGRYIAFRFFLKKQTKVGDGLMYGVGHGGMEVYLAFSLALVNQLVLMMMANLGSLEALTAASPEQAGVLSETIRLIAESNPWATGVGLVERIIAMTLHCALSVIVFCAVRQRRWRYLVLAIALHALVNSSTALYAAGMIGIWQTEALLAVCTVAVALIAWRIARRYQQDSRKDIPLLSEE